MDMLGGSPQSDCYLTQGVYTVLPHFRSGFRLCSATIPDLPGVSIGRLEGGQAKRDTFPRGFGVARFGVPISAWPEVSHALLPAGDGGPGMGCPSAEGGPKTTKVGGRRFGVVSTRKARYLKAKARSGAKRCCARFAAAQASAVAMTKDEERELREQLARLQQEHRDLDAAISALQHSPGSDLLQVQRLKKRKLHLRDRISYIEDQLTPDIIA